MRSKSGLSTNSGLRSIQSLTADAVNHMVLSILLSEMIVAESDNTSPEVMSFVKDGTAIINDHKPLIHAAAKQYMVTGDEEKLRLFLLPFHHMIRYEAYSPYWLKHCTAVSDPDYTFYNDLIDMYWAWKEQEWKNPQNPENVHSSQAWKTRFALPPTKGLILLRYKEVMRHYKTTQDNAR